MQDSRSEIIANRISMNADLQSIFGCKIVSAFYSSTGEIVLTLEDDCGRKFQIMFYSPYEGLTIHSSRKHFVSSEPGIS